MSRRVSSTIAAGFSALGFALITATPASADFRIAPSTGGNAGILSQTNNVGQSFTVPAGESRIRDFSLGIYGGGGGAVTFNLDLYSYTGGVVGARIAGGGPFTASADSQNVVQTRVAPAGGVAVNPLGSYLILATRISGGRVAMPVQANVYAGGTAYENNSPFGSVDAIFVVYLAPAPAITGLSPASGPVTGGTSVVITGTSLGSATAVTFGGTAGVVTNNTATSITVTSPARTVGNADVVVTTANGANVNTAADDFAYLAPVPVPTLTEWGLMALGLLMAGGAAFQLQRRHVLP